MKHIVKIYPLNSWFTLFEESQKIYSRKWNPYGRFTKYIYSRWTWQC